MKKYQWMVHISLMNGNQQHYHFILTPQEFAHLLEAAREAYEGKMLPEWMEIEMDKIFSKMFKLLDKHFEQNRLEK